MHLLTNTFPKNLWFFSIYLAKIDKLDPSWKLQRLFGPFLGLCEQWTVNTLWPFNILSILTHTTILTTILRPTNYYRFTFRKIMPLGRTIDYLLFIQSHSSFFYRKKSSKRHLFVILFWSKLFVWMGLWWSWHWKYEKDELLISCVWLWCKQKNLYNITIQNHQLWLYTINWWKANSRYMHRQVVFWFLRIERWVAIMI